MPKRIYLDANFLVAYFVDEHTKNRDSVQKMAELLVDDCEFYISALTLDETWYAIHEYYQSGNEFRTHFPELESIFNRMNNSALFKFIQFESLVAGIVKALDNINKFNLRPRDSFHLALAEDQKVDVVVAYDSHLNKIQNPPILIETF